MCTLNHLLFNRSRRGIRGVELIELEARNKIHYVQQSVVFYSHYHLLYGYSEVIVEIELRIYEKESKKHRTELFCYKLTYLYMISQYSNV